MLVFVYCEKPSEFREGFVYNKWYFWYSFSYKINIVRYNINISNAWSGLTASMRLDRFAYICSSVQLFSLVIVYNRTHQWHVQASGMHYMSIHLSCHVKQESGLYEYKVFGSLPGCPPELCADVYMDLNYRKQWDSYVKGTYISETFSLILGR